MIKTYVSYLKFAPKYLYDKLDSVKNKQNKRTVEMLKCCEMFYGCASSIELQDFTMPWNMSINLKGAKW